MTSTGKLSLESPTPRPIASSDNALVDLVRTKANYIWIYEGDAYPPPLAPDFEQRAFRKVFAFSNSKGKPTSAMFVIGADDYFALYVNGVMVQAADGTHDWATLVGLQVPLPVVQDTTTDSMTLAFRVVNKLGNAGLMVGVQVIYDLGEPDIFFTGLDDSWTAEKTFDEGWEQPWYSAKWARAEIFPPATRSSDDPNVHNPLNIDVFKQLPANPTPTVAGECATVDDHSSSIGLSTGASIGVLLASVLAALAIGISVSFFVMRKRAQKVVPRGQDENLNGPGHGTPILELPTLPGRPLNLSGASPNHSGGVASPPPPNNRYSSAAFSALAGSTVSPPYSEPLDYRSHDPPPPTYTNSDYDAASNPPHTVSSPVRRKGQGSQT